MKTKSSPQCIWATVEHVDNLETNPGETYNGGEDFSLAIADVAADTMITEVTTTIVHEPIIQFPDQDDEIEWRSSIEGQNDIRAQWRLNNATAAIFDIRIRLNYQEAINGDIDNQESKSAVFTVLKNIEPDDEDDTSIVAEILATDILAGISSTVDASGPGPRFVLRCHQLSVMYQADLVYFPHEIVRP